MREKRVRIRARDTQPCDFSSEQCLCAFVIHFPPIKESRKEKRGKSFLLFHCPLFVFIRYFCRQFTQRVHSTVHRHEKPPSRDFPSYWISNRFKWRKSVRIVFASYLHHFAESAKRIVSRKVFCCISFLFSVCVRDEGRNGKIVGKSEDKSWIPVSPRKRKILLLRRISCCDRHVVIFHFSLLLSRLLLQLALFLSHRCCRRHTRRGVRWRKRIMSVIFVSIKIAWVNRSRLRQLTSTPCHIYHPSFLSCVAVYFTP